jgi:uncharacterized protein
MKLSGRGEPPSRPESEPAHSNPQPNKISSRDSAIAPIGPALRVADHAPKSQLHRSRGSHYHLYKGGADHDNVVRVEVEFLHRRTAFYEN